MTYLLSCCASVSLSARQRQDYISVSNRKYHLDVWMTVYSISMSYTSFHQTLIINNHTLMTHSKTKPCQGARDQHLTTTGSFKEGASFSGKRRIILFFFYGCCSDEGEKKGSEPSFNGGTGGGSACMRQLGHRREVTGAEGTRRMKLCCEELSRAVTSLSWVQGRSISHLHREFAYF